jgi:hypothetical protein
MQVEGVLLSGDQAIEESEDDQYQYTFNKK